MWSKFSFGAKWAAALSDQLKKKKKGMKMGKTRIHLDTLKKVCNKTEERVVSMLQGVLKKGGFSASKPKKKLT